MISPKTFNKYTRNIFMANLSVSSLGAIESTVIETLGTRKYDKDYEFFTSETPANQDDFVTNTDEKTIEQKKSKVKSYKIDRGDDVTEIYQNGKLVSKKMVNHWRSVEAAWNNGKLTVLDYHEPNEEFDYGADSYRIEIKEDGTYIFQLRKKNKDAYETQKGNIRDEDFKEIKKSFIDYNIYYMLNKVY